MTQKKKAARSGDAGNIVGRVAFAANFHLKSIHMHAK